VQTIRQLDHLRTAVADLRSGGRMIALVPTMGALHAGHMALVEQATALGAHVVVSIFVNPLQFGVNEDLARYPRQEEEDAALLEAADVSLLWLPPVAEVYPPGFATNISVARLGEGLCGAARPGHFDGVATVVAKLFTQVCPDVAIFGEKDWQQLAIIRRMATDLNLPVQVIGAPIVRAADGLALSSRNAYLSQEHRAAATVLPEALRAAVRAIEGGAAIPDEIGKIISKLLEAGFSAVDYVELVDAETLEPLQVLDREARILAAARIGETRLIDNFPASPMPPRKK
jgi:pantoate--beta-alanine ligase